VSEIRLGETEGLMSSVFARIRLREVFPGPRSGSPALQVVHPPSEPEPPDRSW
jgi:hypothetical protein